jgi:beta-glucosidase
MTAADTPAPLTLDLPPGFVWGAATAAYQIEGAATEDGRGPSIWDTFSHTPGKVLNGDTGDVAVDHYHRYAEDIELMRGLGLGAYRFSVAWPRIVPSGRGAVNQRGIDFYSRLVDHLLAAGIQPYPTLYHWDLPQPCQDAGGWANRDTAAQFAEYSAVVAAALGDRVSMFTTLNEPWCSAFLGHASGVHAPGITDNATALAAAHHLNLAHGLGAAAVRASAPRRVDVAVTLNLYQVVPGSDSAADADAGRAVDAIGNRMFLDPILRGQYPDDLLADTADTTDWAFVADSDLATIAVGRPDVLGVNFYSPAYVAAMSPTQRERLTKRWVNDPQGADEPSIWPGSDRAMSIPQEGPRTGIGWRVDATALTALLLRLHADYPDLPMMITENGAAYPDVVSEDGAVHDPDRVAYLAGHIGAVASAVAQGADVRGYFLWSLLDNFEWAWGYAQRFGMVYVDFDTLQRTPKDSAHWYRDTIAASVRSWRRLD